MGAGGEGGGESVGGGGWAQAAMEMITGGNKWLLPLDLPFSMPSCEQKLLLSCWPTYINIHCLPLKTI